MLVSQKSSLVVDVVVDGIVQTLPIDNLILPALITDDQDDLPSDPQPLVQANVESCPSLLPFS